MSRMHTLHKLHTLSLAVAALLVASSVAPRLAAAQAPDAAPTAGRNGIPASTQFMLLVYETPAAQRARTRTADAAKSRAYWGAFAAFGDSLQAAGVLRGGMVLRDGAEARTVVVRGGETRVRPGAHARAAEELGGFFLIEVATREEAVRWAARVPAALTGAVEVRPSYPAPSMMAR